MASMFTQYDMWQWQVLSDYNARNDVNYTFDNVDILENGSVYEGNMSYDTGYITWADYASNSQY